MRIFFAANSLGAEGIGTFARALGACLSSRAAARGHSVVSSELLMSKRFGRQLGRFYVEQILMPHEAKRFDLIHLADFRPLLASNRPFLLTIHDVFFLAHPQWYPRSVVIYKRAMLKAALLKRPRAIAFVSEHSRREFSRHVGDLKIPKRVIHPGISSPTTPAQDDASKEGFFLTVGSIEPRRNHLALLTAFQEARRRGVDLEWRVAGRTSYLGAGIAARLAATPGVEVLGEVSQAELERLYALSRFVVTPSLAEGFGFPPLEAMARGAAVVCATGTGLDEAVGDSALRVEPDDVEGWTRALIHLAHDTALLEDLRLRGRRRVAGFDWGVAADSYFSLYEEILA